MGTPSKSKRKPGGAAEPGRETKRPFAEPSAAFKWDNSVLHASIRAGKALVFTGEASLRVTSGRAFVNGALFEAGSPNGFIAADAAVTGPLLIEPLPVGGQVPYAAPDQSLTVRLTPLDPGLRRAAGLAPTPDGPGFRVWLSDDPAAPAARRLPDRWFETVEAVAERAQPGAATMVVGPKKVGKSACARLLVNTLLHHQERVLYLETDCGQPEFGPPGLVSLWELAGPVVGPASLHQPHRQLLAGFIGDTSPASDAAAYIAAVACLAREARARAMGLGLPIVVNSHGWTKGAGLDVLRGVAAACRPTTLVQICSGDQRRDLSTTTPWWEDDDERADGGADDFSREQCNTNLGVLATMGPVPKPQLQPEVWLLPALGSGPASSSGGGSLTPSTSASDLQAQQQQGKSAADLRALQWTSWVRHCCVAMGGAGGGSRADGRTGVNGDAAPAETLCMLRPYSVALDALIVLAPFQGRQLAPAEIPRALNGVVVGLLVSHTGASVDGDDDDGDDIVVTNRGADSGWPIVLQQPSTCVGLGIVRAVDASMNKLYLLTPCPEEDLRRVDTLAVGRLDLPGALLQSPRVRAPYVVDSCLPTLGTGAGLGRSRANLQRSGQQETIGS